MTSIVIKGNTSGQIELAAPDVAGSTTLTLPTGSGNIIKDDGSGNLSVSGAITGTGGIYLGGTSAANLLDDYEEGTWTPTLTSGAGSLTNAVAEYRKIGDMVYLQMYVTLTSITGEVVLGGLPFAPYDAFTASQVENTGVIFGENGDAMWSVYSGNSIHIYLQGSKLFSNGSGTTTPNSGNWRGSIWYRATA